MTFPQSVGAVQAEMHENWLAGSARLGRSPQRRPIHVPRVPLGPVYEPDDGVPANMLLRPNWRFLVKLAALRHGVTVEDIHGISRKRNHVAGRAMAIWLVHTHCPHFSIPELGRLFNRDHTTALHAIKKFTGERRRQW